MSKIAWCGAVVLSLSACGPGTPAIHTASVASNPLNALSAHVTATVTDVATLSVRYALEGSLNDGAAQTPRVSASNGTYDLPVLGLSPNTHYDMQVVAITPTGKVLTESLPTFTTGAVPPAAPTFAIADGGIIPGGYTLIAPVTGVANDAGLWPPAVIIDGLGNVVWYYEANGPILDFQKQPDGTYTVATKQVDSLGNLQRSWFASDSNTDAHELRLLPDRQGLLFGYDLRNVDLTPYGGQPATPVLATTIERIDWYGKQLFRWDPFDWLSVGDIDPSISLTPTPPLGEGITTPAVDWTHGNALEIADDGNYLASFRDISTIVKLNSSTGEVIWRLGGKHSDFTFPDDPLGGPSMQHGIRELPNGHVIMFDNGVEHTPPQSRAVEYALDTVNHVAHLVWSFEPTPHVFAFAMGFADRLPDGNTLITYGTADRIQEVSPQGDVLWDVKPSNFVYRATRIESLY